MILTALFAAAQIPPPIVGTAPGPSAALVSFSPGLVRCGTDPVRPIFAPTPIEAQTFGVGSAAFAPVTLRFRIDASGRPLGISQPERTPGPYFSAEDLAATLAAWRFAAGQARGECSLTFVPSGQPVTTAPIAMVHRAFAMPHVRGLAESGLRKRLRSEWASCFTPKPPAVRNRAFPDFEAIPQPPGTSSYAMVGFDIDAKGRPTRVRILSSEGNATLDEAAIDAVKKSRFGPSARRGCSYPYHRRQPVPMAPPPAPEVASFRREGAKCDEDQPWTLPPRMIFPDAFRRRAIEGWAMIGYDVAPWGATGNVVVLASEPAAAFGESAAAVLRAARRPESFTGATGCVERVMFKMARRSPSQPEPGTPPPPF